MSSGRNGLDTKFPEGCLLRCKAPWQKQAEGNSKRSAVVFEDLNTLPLCFAGVKRRDKLAVLHHLAQE